MSLLFLSVPCQNKDMKSVRIHAVVVEHETEAESSETKDWLCGRNISLCIVQWLSV